MKSVLISIQPKWCELIASGKKTVEARKTAPKIKTPFKVYIYETKDKRFENIGYCWEQGKTFVHSIGKVIGEFVCDNIAKGNSQMGSCLTMREINEYAKCREIYGWHISDLVIYDKPKELREFKKPCIRDCGCGGCEYAIWTFKKGFEGCMLEWGLKQPPQSWCYVEG